MGGNIGVIYSKDLNLFSYIYKWYVPASIHVHLNQRKNSELAIHNIKVNAINDTYI